MQKDKNMHFHKQQCLCQTAIVGECEGEGKGGQTRVLLVKRAL